MVCPLLIPLLINVNVKKDGNEDSGNDEVADRNEDASCTSKAKEHLDKFRYFYMAPVVKFCLHSVTIGTLR